MVGNMAAQERNRVDYDENDIMPRRRNDDDSVAAPSNPGARSKGPSPPPGGTGQSTAGQHRSSPYEDRPKASGPTPPGPPPKPRPPAKEPSQAKAVAAPKAPPLPPKAPPSAPTS